MNRPRLMTLLCAATLAATAGGASERFYLSGTGPQDAVTWDFRLSSDGDAGAWSTIAVPSQWEQEGFGSYTYGWEEDKPEEVGEYRYRFEAPARFERQRTWIVFEGSMTDTEVRLNGEPLGPFHQGGFTRFAYPVDRQLRAGETNLLEVRVSSQSANRSVNRAERDADYWVFGGIFRPVYIEAKPQDAVHRVAIAADHTGDLEARVDLLGDAGVELAVAVREVTDDRIVESFQVPVGGSPVAFRRKILSIRPWSAESPQLYALDLVLTAADGSELHRHREQFGFRSIEVDPEQGILVNGRRVLLKGINRHSFRPETGRALTDEQNEEDARLIKGMNMNAVRTSHYPPDVAFLEACDRLGLYVLDELPGWHDAYDTAVGARLVREMVERDRNHPSILFWNNGNEGGWNSRLDAHFGRYDLQQRPVLHPDDIYSGLDTEHYPTFTELRQRLTPSVARRLLPGPPPLVMPTETLHGLYDGGLGAGLADYWELIRASPLGAGLFLWVFADEGIARTDRDGWIDTFTNLAPDGIVGPHHENEASVLAVREIWSPVTLSAERLSPRAGPLLTIGNRFDQINLKDCRLEWAWSSLPAPDPGAAVAVLAEGVLQGPDLGPGDSASLDLGIGPPVAGSDLLTLSVFDPTGIEVTRRTWPLRGPAALANRVLRDDQPSTESPTARQTQERIELVGGGTTVRLDPSTGRLDSIESGGKRLSLGGGPRGLGFVTETAAEVLLRDELGSATALFRYGSGFDYVRWRLDDQGWLHLRYQYRVEATADLEGVLFDYPAEQLESVDWLSAGPYPVWRNRTAGSRLGLWTRKPSTEPFWQTWDYPRLEGFYASPYWARVSTSEGTFTLLFESDSEVFLSLLERRVPEGESGSGEPMGGYTRSASTAATFALLHEIPGVGTKFHPADDLGPTSSARREPGVRRGAVAFRFQPNP